MSSDYDSLDNPIWHALTSRHQRLSVTSGLAARYLPLVSAFCGLSIPSSLAFEDLGKIVPAGDTVALFTGSAIEVPSEWEIQRHRQIDQMVCKQRPRSLHIGVVTLGLADVVSMSALVAITQPGPFQQRTIEMGRYFGVKSESGDLIAMAGERLDLGGFTEISAVCTHPGHRGRGLSQALVSHVANTIFDAGKIPFLHVKNENEARYLYKKVGFESRAAIDLTVIVRR